MIAAGCPTQPRLLYLGIYWQLYFVTDHEIILGFWDSVEYPATTVLYLIDNVKIHQAFQFL